MPSVEKVARTDSGLASALRISVARLQRRLRSERDPDNELLPWGSCPCSGCCTASASSTVGELAAHERVQPPSMTRTVNCLEDGGYVVRRKHATDGRQVVVALSEQGRATARQRPAPPRRLARAAAARAHPRRARRAARGRPDPRKAGPVLSPTFRALSQPQLPAVRRPAPWCRTSAPGCSASPRTGWSCSSPHNSGTALGITTGLQFLPILLLSPFAGVIADRFPKRRLLQVTQLMLAVPALAARRARRHRRRADLARLRARVRASASARRSTPRPGSRSSARWSAPTT